MLLYNIIKDMSADKPEKKNKSNLKIIKSLKKLDEEYNRAVLSKEKRGASRSRSFN